MEEDIYAEIQQYINKALIHRYQKKTATIHLVRVLHMQYEMPVFSHEPNREERLSGFYPKINCNSIFFCDAITFRTNTKKN